MSRFLQRVIEPGLRPVRPRGRAAAPLPPVNDIETRIEEPPSPKPFETEALPPTVPGERTSEGALPVFPPPGEEKRFRSEPASFPAQGPERAAAASSALPPGDVKGEAVQPVARPRSPKVDAEIISADAVEFDPARPGPPIGRRPKGFGAMKRSEPPLHPDRRALPSAGEIVWEVVPTESPSRAGRPIFPQRGPVHQAESPSQKQPLEGERSGPHSPDPLQSFLSMNRPPQGATKEGADRGPFPKWPAAPILPGSRVLPSEPRSEEEKGDLIIEQLDVRIVAEPARAPQAPRPRTAAPKPSGAWETATRYYLGKL